MDIQSLSNIEISHQARWLNASLKDYYVNNVYWAANRALLLRLHHPASAEKRLVVDCGKAIWLTNNKIEGEGSDNSLHEFRKMLLRGKIISLTQLSTERIIYLDFTGCIAAKLVAEFFGNGNILLIDENDSILTALDYFEAKHRTIRPGNQYISPPTRGIDPLEVNENTLRPVLLYEDDFRKWVGKNIALSRKYIDLLPTLINVPVGSKGNQLNEIMLKELVTQIHNFFDENKANIKPTIFMEGDGIVGFSLYPIAPSKYNLKEVESLNTAIDLLYTKNVIEKKDMKILHPLNRESEGIRVSIRNLHNKKEALHKDKETLAEIANSIKENMALYYQNNSELEKKIAPAKILIENGYKKIIYGDFKYNFIENNPLRNVSQIFDTTKILSKEILRIESSIKKLGNQLKCLEEKVKLKEASVARKHKTVFEREWFERYRWFYTSDNLLAIGGRDSSSNEAIIKKHLEDDDIVFHAEWTGAPFFILKKGKRASEASIKEVGTAAAAFSNLWKFNVSSGEAYWVYKDQVSKKVPSGQYLNKGAFMILGKKNTIKNLTIELGICLFKIREHDRVLCGPIQAIEKMSRNYITITPGREDKNTVAKEIRKSLSERTGHEDIRSIEVEEFTQALPPGGSKIRK